MEDSVNNTYIKLINIQNSVYYNKQINVFLYVDKSSAIFCKLKQKITETKYLVYFLSREDEPLEFEVNIENLYFLEAIFNDGSQYMIKPSQWTDIYNLFLYNKYTENWQISHSPWEFTDYLIKITDLSKYQYEEVIDKRNSDLYQNISNLEFDVSEIESKYNIKLTTLNTIQDAFNYGLSLGNSMKKLNESTRQQLWQKCCQQYIPENFIQYYDTNFKVALTKSLSDLIINNQAKFLILIHIIFNIILIISCISILFEKGFNTAIILPLIILISTNSVLIYYSIIRPIILYAKKS